MVRLAATISPGSANCTPGRKGGRAGSRAGTQGLGPAWNCNECAGRVQNYGAAPWGRSSVRYRTASRFIRSGPPACTAWCVAGALAARPQEGNTLAGACLRQAGGRLRLSPFP